MSSLSSNSSRIFESSILLPLNRRIAYCEYGDRLDFPIIFFHGFGDCRYAFMDHEELEHKPGDQGVRLIVPDRPGTYNGKSSPYPPEVAEAITRGTTDIISAWLADLAEFVVGLRLEKFGILGHSMGSAYALGAAGILDDLIGKVHSREMNALQPDAESSSSLPYLPLPKLSGIVITSAMVPKCYGTKGMRLSHRLYWNLLHRVPAYKRALRWALLRKGTTAAAGPVAAVLTLGMTSMRREVWEAVERADAFPYGLGDALLEVDALMKSGKPVWGFKPRNGGEAWRAASGDGIVFMHGSRDEMFPIQNAVVLARDVPNSAFTTIEGGTHNGILQSQVAGAFRWIMEMAHCSVHAVKVASESTISIVDSEDSNMD